MSKSMNPLFRATTATMATLVLVQLSDCTSGVVATDRHQQQQAHNTQWHRANKKYFGIEANDNNLHSKKKTRNLDESFFAEEYNPPWKDPIIATPIISVEEFSSSPSESPTRTKVTASPTVSPTASPTARTTTSSPTRIPTAIPVTIAPTFAPYVAVSLDPSAVLTTTFDEVSGIKETSCKLMPSIGTFVTKVFDIQYFLYLDDQGIDDRDAIQSFVDSSIEPRLHDALVDIGMGCNSVDFITGKHVMVDLSSSGQDLVGSQCSINSISINDDGLLPNATACHEVWGQIEATMWFAPRRRRQLQGSTTPFGDREAFNEFTDWMEEAFDSMAGSGYSDSDAETGVDVLKVSFQGFVNINGFDGTNLELPQDVGIDRTAAFMGSAFSVDDGGINIVFGTIAIVVGVMVFAFVILFVAVRRKRNQEACLEHARCVEELMLDSKDDMNVNPDVVDDESLFQEERPLPEDFKVKLESADHDYRWIGEDRKNPIFVATDRNMEFLDHLNVLQQRKDQEERERQYESVML